MKLQIESENEIYCYVNSAREHYMQNPKILLLCPQSPFSKNLGAIIYVLSPKAYKSVLSPSTKMK